MLKLDNVHKIFHPGGVNEKVALRGVTLHVRPGDVVTIIGSNGAGKSTLLNVVAGVYEVDAGKVILDNQDITRWPEHIRAAHIGRVFQDPLRGTAASMTIEENLALALRRGRPRRLRRGITRAERQLFKERLALLGLGLENRLTTRVGLLSGGQRQALTVLMATIATPKILLLDEHTAALDPRTAATVMELTERIIARHRLTTLMVTHNLAQALHTGNRTIMMHEGRIILDLCGPERERTTVADLLRMFEQASGDAFTYDRALLSGS
ncbi:ABC transporter ATP-binding protein [Desulfofundulus thermocisternus]|uniref:ABC transporter ATP-binding protein n=1 Tax=Desulfofundulus thermocisternus TaxID=42471 RepID=UPI0019EF8112|nr:ATP-binding cassette domain-containing protein [Desulfofundulus thermocisternus]MBE3586479.1 ATP-binding cassette domain-containing protein [Thermoanaerobacter sp.]MCS5696790.1 ATP-binding cassette domain-containing protein [Desulfofundulus thermocisternus]